MPKDVSAFRYNVRMKEITPEPQNRTEEENKQTINRLLNLYDLMLLEYSKLIENVGQDDTAENDKDKDKKDKKDKHEKSDILTEFKAFATLADTLMKRWNIAHRGYDTNASIAAADAKAAQQASESIPDKARKGETVDLHPDMESAVENLPKGHVQLTLEDAAQNGNKDNS
ncbi:MAG: hypothetical protein OXI67_09720 [Candidatus Poribacteria bacterium]|nr:hypothetical protein [Candidatus Poribacteria bacterium]